MSGWVDGVWIGCVGWWGGVDGQCGWIGGVNGVGWLGGWCVD